QLSAAADGESSVQRFHVIVNGVPAEAQLAGDLLFAVALKQAGERLPHARRQMRRDFELVARGYDRMAIRAAQRFAQVATEAASKSRRLSVAPSVVAIRGDGPCVCSRQHPL